MSTAALTPSRPVFTDTVLASPVQPNLDSPGLPAMDDLRINGPVKLVKYLPEDKKDAFIGPLHNKVEDTIRFVQRECPSLSQVPAESIIFRPRVTNTAKHTRGVPFRTQTVSLPTTWEPPVHPEKLMVMHIDSKVPGPAPLVPESIREEVEPVEKLEGSMKTDQQAKEEEEDQVAKIAKIMVNGPPQKPVEAVPWSPALPAFSINFGPKTWDDLAAEGMLLGE